MDLKMGKENKGWKKKRKQIKEDFIPVIVQLNPALMDPVLTEFRFTVA